MLAVGAASATATPATCVYRGERTFIHIDIEPHQIGKVFPADLGHRGGRQARAWALLAEAQARATAARRRLGERGWPS